MTKKRIVFIMDGGLTMKVAPEFQSEEYELMDIDILDVYALDELELACTALRLDFEGITGYCAEDASNLNESDQFEVYELARYAIKEALNG